MQGRAPPPLNDCLDGDMANASLFFPLPRGTTSIEAARQVAHCWPLIGGTASQDWRHSVWRPPINQRMGDLVKPAVSRP